MRKSQKLPQRETSRNGLTTASGTSWISSVTNRLAETLVSQLLCQSNIEQDTPFKFVRYDISRVIAHGRERVCCASADFLKEGQSIITLAHLLKREVGESMKQQLGKLPSDKARIRYIAEQTAEITGLHDFPQYLTLLFEIDSLILNDDRHLNNIAVLEQGGAYDYCPIFDNGAGLLSNMQVYNVGIEREADPVCHVKAVQYQIQPAVGYCPGGCMANG